jgi:hypothetical protein
MVAVPGDVPVTTPVPSTGATEISLLDHVPLLTPSANAVALPWHKIGVPVTGAKGYTVNDVVATQPEVVVYCMVVAPAPTAVTRPVVLFAVAMPVARLLHVPPDDG